MIEDRLVDLLSEALRIAAPDLGIDDDLPRPELLAPRRRDHGDFATNVALGLAKRVGKPPREVAQAIADAVPSAPFLEKIEVAGPGFLNLFTTDEWLHDALREVADAGEAYGRVDPDGRRAQVEFVSANPTGPLTLGHARNAAIGDALARLLEATGWTVEREYYFNDAGGQMDRFGASVEARFLQLTGRDAQVPDDGYHGAYVEVLARDILDIEGPGLADLGDGERLLRMRAEGMARVLRWIEATLERFGVTFDVYFRESELAAKGEIEAAVERLRDAGAAYDAEGATWFRSTAYGDDKDRVVVRSNGLHTYFGADCAYLVDKFSRGFDRLLYVWGADHHGDVARVKGAAQALGYDPDAVEPLVYQWVSFLRDGEPVPMGKRSGNFIALDQLLEEVGTDAARFTLLLYSNDAAINFDIEAVKRRSMDNPVYYVQYGHARIASILAKAAREGVMLDPIENADLTLLATDAETDLLRGLAEVPELIAYAAELRAPHRVAHASQDLAARFHRFYSGCRVVSDDAELTQARLWLAAGTKQVLANLLALLGVSAPESMERADDDD
ncbi:MAG: arginine--tRNA ligase [Actinomycetota bacterium]|nr:arginine--tRNA ligase [Actinomycetota bacterium]MDH5224911.1 arginine--tRNA ligase [Actinomycetota bacterium]MDH5313510.1 arginine--tRNA ligase [Actinomycetota bacterium]